MAWHVMTDLDRYTYNPYFDPRMPACNAFIHFPLSYIFSNLHIPLRFLACYSYPMMLSLPDREEDAHLAIVMENAYEVGWLEAGSSFKPDIADSQMRIDKMSRGELAFVYFGLGFTASGSGILGRVVFCCFNFRVLMLLCSSGCLVSFPMVIYIDMHVCICVGSVVTRMALYTALYLPVDLGLRRRSRVP